MVDVPWVLRPAPSGYFLAERSRPRIYALITGAKGNWAFTLYDEGGKLMRKDPVRRPTRNKIAALAWRAAIEAGFAPQPQPGMLSSGG